MATPHARRATAAAPPTAGARTDRTRTGAYFLGFGLVGLLSATLGPALVSLAAAVHRPPAQMGIVFTADAFGSVCGSLLAGALLTRLRPHLQAAAGLVSITAFLLVIPQVRTFTILLVTWWALGLSKTFLIVTVNTMLIRIRRDHVGTYICIADFFLGSGSLLMPVIVGQSISRTGGPRAAFYVAAAVAVVLLAIMVTLPSPDMDEAGGHDPAGDAGPDDADPASQAANGRRRNPAVIPIAVLLFFYVGAETSFAGWLPYFTLAQHVTNSPATAAYYTSAFWIAITAGRLLWLPLARRVRPQRLVLAGALGSLPGIAMLVLGRTSGDLVLAGTVAAGVFMASIFPSAFSWLARRGTVTGPVSALCLCTSSLGAMFFPWWLSHFLSMHS